ELQKQYYERYYPEQKFLTAVTGIKTHKQYPAKEQFSYKIGYIGSLKSRDYDLPFLFSMFAQVRTAGVKLVIAGAKNHNDIKKVESYIAKYNLKDRVEIHNWLPPEEVDMLKRELDIGCAPMVISPRSRMCSPLKVLEYLSAGIPVIGTKLEGIEYLIANDVNGFTLENDETQWAAAIDSLYSDIETYRAFSRECLKTAGKFSWEQRARKIYHFLSNEILNES
ncbi:glycosyltransferase, partial [candidate division KSB1 bacterium]|nr:glycosyltransferase [candidate division KSB1 bacterium]